MSEKKKTLKVSSDGDTIDTSSSDNDDTSSSEDSILKRPPNLPYPYRQEKEACVRMLFASARDGDLEMIKCLVENKKVNPDESLEDYEVPLHIAIKNKHNDIAKYLIEHGSEFNNVNPSNESAIYFAYRTGNDEMVEYLLDKGADTLIQTKDLGFPFDEEIQKKLSKLAAKLMKEKIAKNKK